MRWESARMSRPRRIHKKQTYFRNIPSCWGVLDIQCRVLGVSKKIDKRKMNAEDIYLICVSIKLHDRGSFLLRSETSNLNILSRVRVKPWSHCFIYLFAYWRYLCRLALVWIGACKTFILLNKVINYNHQKVKAFFVFFFQIGENDVSTLSVVTCIVIILFFYTYFSRLVTCDFGMVYKRNKIFPHSHSFISKNWVWKVCCQLYTVHVSPSSLLT